MEGLLTKPEKVTVPLELILPPTVKVWFWGTATLFPIVTALASLCTFRIGVPSPTIIKKVSSISKYSESSSTLPIFIPEFGKNAWICSVFIPGNEPDIPETIPLALILFEAVMFPASITWILPENVWISSEVSPNWVDPLV